MTNPRFSSRWVEAEKSLLKDKYIGPLIEKYGHCSIRKQFKTEYFIDLVNAIISQQLSGKAAATIFGRVKVGLGKITPENILKTSDEKFRSWGLSRAKTVYVKDLAEKIQSSKLKITSLDKFPDEEIIKELIKVKGIGPWTAEMFLMFTLGRPDRFPIEDLGIRKGVQKLINKSINQDEIDKFATRWKPWRTVASWYLWRSLENN